MTEQERIALQTLLGEMLAGSELPEGMSVHLMRPIVCPYCFTESPDFEAAKTHDGECKKHPMAVKLAALESELATQAHAAMRAQERDAELKAREDADNMAQDAEWRAEKAETSIMHITSDRDNARADAANAKEERDAALTLAEPLDRLYEWAKRTIRADLHSPLEVMGEYESLREERDRMAQIIYDTQDLYRHFPVLSGWGRDPGKPEHLVSQITNILNLYSDSCRTLALIAKERDELAAEWGTEGCPSPVVRGKQILAAVKARAKAEGRIEALKHLRREFSAWEPWGTRHAVCERIRILVEAAQAEGEVEHAHD